MSKYLPIAQRLREEREKMQLNQSDFAAIAGATRKTQYNYEAGERSPDASYLAAIAEAGADVNYILTGVRLTDVPKLDRQVQMAVDVLNSMSKKQRDLALSFLAHSEPAELRKAG